MSQQQGAPLEKAVLDLTNALAVPDALLEEKSSRLNEMKSLSDKALRAVQNVTRERDERIAKEKEKPANIQVMFENERSAFQKEVSSRICLMSWILV
jgi:hypothetical protein